MGGVLHRLERTAMTSVSTVVEVGEHLPQLSVYKSRGSLWDDISHCLGFLQEEGEVEFVGFFFKQFHCIFPCVRNQEEYRIVFSISGTIITE